MPANWNNGAFQGAGKGERTAQNNPKPAGGFPSGWASEGSHHEKVGRYSSGITERKTADGSDSRLNTHLGRSIPWTDNGKGRNARSIWTITTQPYAGAHFATFPEELARRCILAGSLPGETVLDPFGGSGTVPFVATNLGRPAVYIDLNPAYVQMATQRLGPLVCEVAG